MELQTIKDYLKITWPEEDNDLKTIINSGKSYLDELTGVKLDYVNDHTVIQLLKDYCRYAYNHSLELFETNFRHELLKLSLREAVKKRATDTTSV